MKIEYVYINGKRIYNNLLSLKVFIITNKLLNWIQLECSNNFIVTKELEGSSGEDIHITHVIANNIFNNINFKTRTILYLRTKTKNSSWKTQWCIGKGIQKGLAQNPICVIRSWCLIRKCLIGPYYYRKQLTDMKTLKEHKAKRTKQKIIIEPLVGHKDKEKKEKKRKTFV